MLPLLLLPPCPLSSDVSETVITAAADFPALPARCVVGARPLTAPRAAADGAPRVDDVAPCEEVSESMESDVASEEVGIGVEMTGFCWRGREGERAREKTSHENNSLHDGLKQRKDVISIEVSFGLSRSNRYIMHFKPCS